MRLAPPAASNEELAERLRRILASRNLTLHQASQKSEVSYGRSSPYFIPHNLYYDLRIGDFSPSIHQLCALSRVSDYQLHDWLRVFGLYVEDIPRLQVLLDSKRTVLLNSLLDDPLEPIPWFENKTTNMPVPPIAPLAEFLKSGHPRRLGSLTSLGSKKSIYMKIGREDAFAYPDLVRGSIVRVDPTVGNDFVPRRNGTTSNRLFLIEHCKGLCCCQLRIIGDSLIVPVSVQLPYSQVELQLPQEARILGVADFEIRPLVKTSSAEVPKELARHWKPKVLTQETSLGRMLRSTRRRMNLSLREASTMSRQVVRLLGDRRYLVSPSSLSDYEVLDTPPRHVHKAVTLCAIYGLQFHTFLNMIGIDPDDLGKEPMPDDLVGRGFVEGPADAETSRTGFLEQLLTEAGEIPFFLRDCLDGISGTAKVSLDDCFWVGGDRNPLHPYLVGALLVVVNRRKRKPVHFRSRPPWEQPLYVILKRDGSYLCACCGVENGTLIVHPYSQQLYRPTQLRYHEEAEVVGQVVAIARKLV